jgi:hypothetical protein
MPDQPSISESSNRNDRTAGRSGGEAGPVRMGGVLGVMAMPVVVLAGLVNRMWGAITADGHLAAAGRQGLDELGAALKPMPDSIQTQETGTVWNPTQGEIAAARDHGWQRGNYASYSHSRQPPHPWPSEIAEHNRRHPGNDHGHDNGQDHGHSL